MGRPKSRGTAKPVFPVDQGASSRSNITIECFLSGWGGQTSRWFCFSTLWCVLVTNSFCLYSIYFFTSYLHSLHKHCRRAKKTNENFLFCHQEFTFMSKRFVHDCVCSKKTTKKKSFSVCWSNEQLSQIQKIKRFSCTEPPGEKRDTRRTGRAQRPDARLEHDTHTHTRVHKHTHTLEDSFHVPWEKNKKSEIVDEDC